MANPLFSGEIVLSTIAMAGANQHSATRYSNPKKVIEIQKLLLTRRQIAAVGIPAMPANKQTYAFVIKIPFFSNLSEISPPPKAEQKPIKDTMIAFKAK